MTYTVSAVFNLQVGILPGKQVRAILYAKVIRPFYHRRAGSP
jgi:hypothetical protein